jgi:hypothetical protein
VLSIRAASAGGMQYGCSGNCTFTTLTTTGGLSVGGNISVTGFVGPTTYFGKLVPDTADLTSFTCNNGRSGMILQDILGGGTGTLHPTRICLCQSDGAASPTYKWRNIASAAPATALGTSTTCPD